MILIVVILILFCIFHSDLGVRLVGGKVASAEREVTQEISSEMPVTVSSGDDLGGSIDSIESFDAESMPNDVVPGQIAIKQGEQLLEEGWRVVGRDGRPGCGARIFATLASRDSVVQWMSADDVPEDETAAHETWCDLDGCFDLSDVESGLYFVRSELPGYGPGCAMLDLTEAWPADFLVTLDYPKTIEGSVVAGDGERLEGVEVFCTLAIRQDPQLLPLETAYELFVDQRCVETGRDGSFRFEDLALSKNYMLHVEHEDYIPVHQEVRYYEYHPQKLVLKAPCLLEGYIRNQAGEPVEGANVTYRYPQVSVDYGDLIATDSTGFFRFEAATEGFVHLQAMHAKYGNSARDVEVRPGRVNRCDLALPPGLELEVMVSEESGALLEGIKVMVTDVTTGTFVGGDYTDAGGRVLFSGLNRGSRNYVRVVDHKGYFTRCNMVESFDQNTHLPVVVTRRSAAPIEVLDAATHEPVRNFQGV